MRILLDNCIDRNFRRLITGHEVRHARECGWSDLENGRLLAAAASAEFQAFVTVDKNIRYQQNLSRLPLPIVELDVIRARIDDLAPLAAYLDAAFERSRSFRFVSIKPDGTLECLVPWR
jgi:hypothetical protein